MPESMPYHLEKGPTLRLLELALSRLSASELRQRCERWSADDGSLDWLLDEPAWSDPAFSKSPKKSGSKIAESMAEEWFGYAPQPDGSYASSQTPTTGYWIAYRGAVDKIVRRTLAWAAQIALGLEVDGTGSARTVPWTIELFWKCPSPWFEGWVISRPVRPPATGDDGQRTNPGLVTVVFVTPSHAGSNVAESPIAVWPTPNAPDIPYRVPSYQSDYEEVLPLPSWPPGKPRAVDRQYATWVVTHRNHVPAGTVVLTTNPAVPTDFADWGIPQLSIYSGYGPNGEEPVVVVSPSMPAGGVSADGTV